ncbi:MAG: hypothetical protein F4023_14465 [Acidobacteria bacterium]|nr:hypothetical protein [Acidobacteriota bacterium]
MLARRPATRQGEAGISNRTAGPAPGRGPTARTQPRITVETRRRTRRAVARFSARIGCATAITSTVAVLARAAR